MKEEVELSKPPSETTSHYVTFKFTFDEHERTFLWFKEPSVWRNNLHKGNLRALPFLERKKNFWDKNLETHQTEARNPEQWEM